MVREKVDKDSIDHQTRSCMASRLDENRWSRSESRKNKKRAKEKPKFDNARRPRGIYFIDPDDQDYKENLKNARRKLEIPMAAVVPCERKAPKGITKFFELWEESLS